MAKFTIAMCPCRFCWVIWDVLPEKKLANFLLMYRNTPNTTTGESPALIFMKRTLQCMIDVMKPNIEHSVVDKLYSSWWIIEASDVTYQLDSCVFVRDYSRKFK